MNFGWISTGWRIFTTHYLPLKHYLITYTSGTLCMRKADQCHWYDHEWNDNVSLQPSYIILQLVCWSYWPMSNSNPKTPHKGQVSNQLYLNQELFILFGPATAHGPCNTIQPLACESHPFVVCSQKKLTNAKFSCIPPSWRHKTDWFHTSMDFMVENDMHEMHWELSSSNSQKLLNFFFPDEGLFPKSKGELVENKSDHFTMDQVLSHLVTKSVYKRKTNIGLMCSSLMQRLPQHVKVLLHNFSTM